MTSTITSATAGDRRGLDLPLWRLQLLRAVYLLIALGEGSQVAPALFVHEPTARGVIAALLAGLCLLCLLGLKYPARMLPLLLLELLWKYVWFFAFGLSQYLSGQQPATFADDFPAITFGVVLMPLVIPWGYVWRHYVTAPAERWR